MWATITKPFAWLMVKLYELTGNYGLAVILFALAVNLVLTPFMAKSKKSMMRSTRLQPRIQELQRRHEGNPQKLNQEMQNLYREEGVNPMSGCLWSFIPFPILIALYYIIRTPLRYFMSLSESVIKEIGTLAASLGYTAAEGTQQAAYEQIYLTKFVHEHWDAFAGKFDGLVNLDYNFLGIDLAATPSSMFSQFPHGGWPMFGLFLLPVIATALQFLMTFVSMKSNGSSGNMNGSSKAMMYMMPLMTLWMGFILPGALSIYWSANAGFSVLQELTLNKYFNKILDREETDKEREKREKRAAKYERQKAMMAEYNNANTAKKKPQQKKQTNGEKRASTNENGRVGQRPYARGRAYSEDHYND